jgi:beta-lactamase class D
MKILYSLPLFILFISCSEKKTPYENKEESVTVLEQEKRVQEFQTIIDSANVKGAVLIYDLEKNQYFSNDFEYSRKGNLPASTFKITNSIIALEAGVVENDSTLFKWNGEKRRLKNWEQDLIFRNAFHFSCVPCYQEIARKIGVKKMTEYLNKLEYGKMKVDSTNIDLFWLEGESRINQFQQIDFLKRFYQSKLPISERTKGIMKRMMVIEENEEYKLSGKTGWSIRNGNNNGWFIGYIESGDKTYFFATNVEPKEQFDMNLFSIIRKEVTYKAFEQISNNLKIEY